MITWTCTKCDTKWLDEPEPVSLCWICGEPGTTLRSLGFTVRQQFLPTEVYNEPIAGII